MASSKQFENQKRCFVEETITINHSMIFEDSGNMARITHDFR